MAQFHFVEDYERHVEHLLANHPLDEAMSLAVGGNYEFVGGIECAMLKWAGLKSGMSVVDFGCGSGRLGHLLGDFLEIDYTGIDIIQSLIDYAKTKCPVKFKFIINQSMKFPIAEKSADFIVAFSVFTHLLPSETYIYMEKMKKALKPGGTLIFSFLEVTNDTHWAAFMGEVEARRSSTNVPLNTLLERSMIVRMSEALGYSIKCFIDAVDAPWGGTPLGQSVVIMNNV